MSHVSANRKHLEMSNQDDSGAKKLVLVKKKKQRACYILITKFY